LQLAIFNSCDGLGLAYALEELALPQMLVMREPVPDVVAVAFLKGFLQAFSQGRSLFAATREARERLEGLEGQFPCASWLPTIYQHSVQTPITWQSLKSPSPERRTQHQPLASLLIACVVACMVIMARTLGLMESLELKAYDHFMALRPPLVQTDDRFVAILIDEEDIQYQINNGLQGPGSLSDAALLQILEKVDPYQPRAIGLDIFHDFPFEPAVASYIQNHENFFAVCQLSAPESKLVGIKPPPNIPTGQVGFVNFPLDSDHIVRRQLLGASPDENCLTEHSLSFLMAWQGLTSPELSQPQFSRPDENKLIIQAGKFRHTFRKLQFNSGGYHLPYKEAQGYQILTNYRKSYIPSYSLRTLLSLEESDLKNLVKDKLLLIGVDKKNVDRHVTPLNLRAHDTLPGILIHLQMSKNIISSVLEDDDSIIWLPEAIDNIWILVWSVTGGLIVVLVNSLQRRVIALFLSQTILCGIAFYALVENVWIPLIPATLGCLTAYFLIGYQGAITPWLAKVQFPK
jgi:CHASE2 domain-containing sensor protein